MSWRGEEGGPSDRVACGGRRAALEECVPAREAAERELKKAAAAAAEKTRAAQRLAEQNQ